MFQSEWVFRLLAPSCDMFDLWQLRRTTRAWHELSHGEARRRKHARIQRATKAVSSQRDHKSRTATSSRRFSLRFFDDTFIVDGTPAVVKIVNRRFLDVPANLTLFPGAPFCPTQLSHINLASTTYTGCYHVNRCTCGCKGDDIWLICYDCRKTFCDCCASRNGPNKHEAHLHHLHNPTHESCDRCCMPILENAFWSDGETNLCAQCAQERPGRTLNTPNVFECMCCPFGSVHEWQGIAQDRRSNWLLLNVSPTSELYDFVAVARRDFAVEWSSWSVEVLWRMSLQEVFLRMQQLEHLPDLFPH